MTSQTQEELLLAAHLDQQKIDLVRCVTNAPKGEDRISSLPDDIIVEILFLLKDMKEAARTSVLSQKWKHLWCNLHNYDFTTSLALPGYKFAHQVNKRVMTKFAHCVHKVVTSSRASSIDRFKVHCMLDATYTRWICTWLMFSMIKNVKQLIFNFSPCRGVSPEFPATLPSLWPYANFPSVLTLVSLTLGGLCVTTDFLESLLFNFTNLEHLTMKNVFCVESEYKGPDSYKRNIKTKIAGSFLKLRHLEMSYCRGFGEVEISAEKLTSLFYTGIEDIKFSYVPQLKDAVFRGNYANSLFCNFGIISGFSSQLSRLILQTCELEKINQRTLEVPNQFGNLTELDLIIAGNPTERLLLVVKFINACPLFH